MDMVHILISSVTCHDKPSEKSPGNTGYLSEDIVVQ